MAQKKNKEMDNPIISVVMATKDTDEKKLELAVASILEQSFEKFEFIIINDGGLLDDVVIRKFKDSRIVFVNHRVSCGLAKRLNEGIGMARGKYIARMDSDDYALKDRLVTQYNFMEKNIDIDMCSAYAREFGDAKKFRFSLTMKPKDIDTILLLTNNIVHPTVMFRAASIRGGGFLYDESFRYSQDYDLWVHMSTNCKMAIIPKVLLFYRVHSNQVSIEKKTEQALYFAKTVKFNLNRLGLKSTDVKYVNTLNHREKTKDFGGIGDFIRRVIKANNEAELYDEKSLRRRLGLAFLVAFAVNRCPHINGSDFKWIIKPYSHICIARRTIMVLILKVSFLRYRRVYDKISKYA